MKKITGTPIGLQNEDRPAGLEWMLQSSQVSDGELIEALQRDFGEVLTQFAVDHYHDPELARQAVLHVLAAVVASQQQYWGDVPLAEWLKQTAGQVFRRLDQKIERREEITFPGMSHTANRQAQIDAVERAILQLRKKRQMAKFIPIASVLGAMMLLFFGLVWWISQPERDPAYVPPEQVRFYYKYSIRHGDTLESIGRLTGVAPQAIKKMNPDVTLPANYNEEILHPEGHGYDIKLPVLKVQPSFLERLQSKLPRQQPSQPLTLQSSSEAIRQRLKHSASYWRTLRADYWMTSYRSPGYIGRPDQYHEQVFARKPDQFRRYSLNTDGAVQYADYQDGNLHFFGFPTDTDSEIRLDFVSDNNQREMGFLNPAGLDLQKEDGSIKLLGSEKVAGRDALVVDWTNSKGRRTHRLWVDTWLGIILAWRYYDGSDGQSPVADMVITDLQVDQIMDDLTFDPSKGSFVGIASNQTEQTGPLLFQANLKWAPIPAPPAQILRPPPGFDPAKSRLTILWPEDNQVLPAEQDPGIEHQVRVFGNEYFLGLLYFGLKDPVVFWDCSRSPDGRLVAVVLGPTNKSSNSLFWFKLNNVNINHRVGIGESPITIDNSSFSPDNQKLAFTAWGNIPRGPGIYIQELDSGHHTRLADTTDPVSFLAWSPDGGRILTIEMLPNLFQLIPDHELRIYEVSSGKQVYSGPFDAEKNQPPADAPIQDWGIDFSRSLLGSKGCAMP